MVVGRWKGKGGRKVGVSVYIIIKKKYMFKKIKKNWKKK